MRRTSLFVVIAFFAGLGVGYFAHRPHADSFLQGDTHAADFAGIERLRQQDIDVTLPQDPKGLIDIFTDDAVRFIPVATCIMLQRRQWRRNSWRA